MKKLNYNDMVRGWFVGNFEPSALKTDLCEVAVQKYKAGDYEQRHCHKIADEVTYILSGTVRMNGVNYEGDDILLIEKGTSTDFESITDSITVVVKMPCAKGDKYIIS
jgi:quercetin dioxygenase-like cupin family protein